MKIVKLTENNFEEIRQLALEVLSSGGLIIYPTETCYGAGVVATDNLAVKKLLLYKKRPSGKAISVAVATEEIAGNYVELNSGAKNVYKKFLPGPVTVVSKSKGKVANGIESEFKTLGVRIPDYKFTLDLLKKLKLPITATSANSAGKKTPYTISDILENISENQKKLINLIIDDGELPKNPPSTVIDTTRESMRVLRQGQILPESKIEQLEINSEEQMRKTGERIVKKFAKQIREQGLLILFNADLGAGKTHFVKGVGIAFGVKDIIKSPTYSLIEEYSTDKGQLIHIDAWRLDNLAELEQLGIENYLKPGNIIAVEWSGAAEEYLLKLTKERNIYLVSIEIDYSGRNTRKLKLIYS